VGLVVILPVNVARGQEEARQANERDGLQASPR
jgi:hypothetical protein